MKFGSKFLLPVFCLLAMLVAACGGSGGTSTAPAQGAHTKAADNKQVYIATGPGSGLSDFASLDPALIADQLSAEVATTLYTGLVSFDNKLDVHPQLAQSWDKASDGLSYTFHLKSGLKFSDGTPLTANDVAYSIDRALQPQMKSTTAAYFLQYIKDSDKLNGGKIKTIIGDSLIVPDDNTITIKLNKPVAFFLDTIANTNAFVVEKSLVQKYGEFTPKWVDHLGDGAGSTGPFKIKSYTHGEKVDLVPNENYYGTKPQLKELIFPLNKGGNATTRKDYLVDRVDDTGIPLTNFTQDKTRPDYHQHPLLAINYYAMNMKIKPFDNTKIRQAFELAVNKDLIVQKVWKNHYIATNHIVPQGQPGYNPDLTGPAGVKGTAGDPAMAKQLFEQGLKEDGYNSAKDLPPLTLTYASTGSQDVRDEMSILQQMWQQVLGVTVKLDDIDFNKLISDEQLSANNPLMFYSGPAYIVDYPDPQDWTTLQFGKGAGQNGMNFGQNNSPDAAAQQALQQRMEQADVMQDPTARLTEYNKIEQELVNDVAWFPIEQQITAGLTKPCVQGKTYNAMNLTPPDDWGKIYISTDTPCANATVS
ncbi:peptide ABC transporter substrate-binding protein [Ktedonosporobacter rubrisoli]|uniref:Peptide ABC transporter substrate-binding protein n=1 Tax=Ktedonosporobacter rubrisoli TaxID=2509675 RepID=A0A4P6JT08_KTERU|nr:peptide ABC transporter substrate-binding protein [Ktedonosporobacter rubrisoli]QBD78554.1 peptide ABC transporter substrate-binding protein [Ktedonosporobacter rubrisoli]